MAKELSISEKNAAVSRQRQITPDNFAALLAALGNTAQEPGIHYERLRSKLIFFFSRKQLQFPEDLADEVLDRLTHRLSEGIKIASIPAFALGIARHVAQEQSAQKPHTQSMDGSFWDNVPAHLTTRSEEDEWDNITRMENCLKKLPKAEARLLRDYYLAASENPMQVHRNLADRLGVSANTLRQRAFLARQSLRACMTATERKKRR